ncbi:MAG: response regulator [Candidatus Omnitrophica bacterium]|nr:response regulator [Candidatus Omnitrophota bacterium]
MPGENILIVDDEPTICIGQERELSWANYHVDTVSDGAEALEIARQKKYDLALIDKCMPGMDGIQTCREIKKISPDLIVILITGGHAIPEVEFLAAGGRICISKPFLQGEVLEAVQKALGEKK